MHRSEIIDQAETYLGASWAHRGRTSNGMDCVGLLILTAQHFGMEIEDIDGYGREPQGEKFVDQLKKHLIIPEQTLKHGRIAVFRDTNYPCHCGFVKEVAPGQFNLLHSTIARRKVVEEVWSREWQTKFRLFLDFPDVED